jgi:subtilisin family serine protease
LEAIKLREGWRYTEGDPRVTVAVIDDGFDLNHELLQGRIVKPYNVFTQNENITKGVHGTHVAGLAVGSRHNYHKGISGVAPKCRLMPVQVFDGNKTYMSAVIAGIMYAIRNDADVINVSITTSFRGSGINNLPREEQERIADNEFQIEAAVWKIVKEVAVLDNSIIVFAAGNDNIYTCIPPEHRTSNSINVSAVDQQRRQTDFTNYNYADGSHISAPGKDIISSVPGGYQVEDGTSMAAPIVSGTIALMKSIKRDLSIDDILHILSATGEAVYGDIPAMVNVDQALEYLCKELGIEKGPEVVPEPEDPSTDEFGDGNGDGSGGKIGGGCGGGNGDGSGGDGGNDVYIKPRTRTHPPTTNPNPGDGDNDYYDLLAELERLKQKQQQLLKEIKDVEDETTKIEDILKKKRVN